MLFARAVNRAPGDLFRIPDDVDEVEIDGDAIAREIIEPDVRRREDDETVPLRVIGRLTRALDAHMHEIDRLHDAVERTRDDAMNVRKTWLRQSEQPQPRKEEQ